MTAGRRVRRNGQPILDAAVIEAMTRKRRYLVVFTSLLAIAAGVALAQPGNPFRRQEPADEILQDREVFPTGR